MFAVRRTSQESLGFKLAALVLEHTAHGSVHLLKEKQLLEQCTVIFWNLLSVFWEKLAELSHT